MWVWNDGLEDHANQGPQPLNQHTIIWHHDESTFYANDWCKVFWVHKDETAVPRAKGEGVSLMVADFVSADYGWLHSPDHTELGLTTGMGKPAGFAAWV